MQTWLTLQCGQADIISLSAVDGPGWVVPFHRAVQSLLGTQQHV